MNSDDDQHNDDGAPVDADAQILANVLSDSAVWAELEPGLEDSIVAAISAEAATVIPITDAHSTTRPTGRKARSSAGRRWAGPIAAGIAAALVLISGFAIATRETTNVDVEVAMTPTDLAPGASAELAIEATPNGTRLILDVSGLPPAPEGKVYEAWLRKSPEVGVSAGTFHMRGGDGDLELWSGVDISDYPLVTVTIQDEADTTSSGQVVLKALVEQ